MTNAVCKTDFVCAQRGNICKTVPVHRVLQIQTQCRGVLARAAALAMQATRVRLEDHAMSRNIRQRDVRPDTGCHPTRARRILILCPPGMVPAKLITKAICHSSTTISAIVSGTTRVLCAVMPVVPTSTAMEGGRSHAPRAPQTRIQPPTALPRARVPATPGTAGRQEDRVL